jgi:hypothetical protein
VFLAPDVIKSLELIQILLRCFEIKVECDMRLHSHESAIINLDHLQPDS